MTESQSVRGIGIFETLSPIIVLTNKIFLVRIILTLQTKTFNLKNIF